MRAIKGTFHAKMGSIKDRNGPLFGIYMVMDREAWRAAVHAVAKSWT